ncbi:hypothetical protein GCM10010151_00220 [Actinoallomurus spadix]|uniref:Uncharacterized protein n=1 Tax=Actinoallomurus spadix TaxID=79912 RepID=A0ABN0VPL1_9ACTN
MNGTAKYSTETSMDTRRRGSRSTQSAIHSRRPALAAVTAEFSFMGAGSAPPLTVRAPDADRTGSYGYG